MLDPSLVELDTARLTLRLHAAADFDECAAMWGDPAVTHHLAAKPFTREESWTRHLRHAGHWSLMGFGYWIVREREGGRFVGEVGFADLKREIEPSLEGMLEIGWVLATRAQGRGYATEAAEAAIRWATTRIAARRIVCLIDVANDRSLRVAEKCGFSVLARTFYKERPVVVLER